MSLYEVMVPKASDYAGLVWARSGGLTQNCVSAVNRAKKYGGKVKDLNSGHLVANFYVAPASVKSSRSQWLNAQLFRI